MSQIFISYSHKDKKHAEELHIQLLEHSFDVWIDNRLDPGVDWEDRILKEIKTCTVFIVLMSSNSQLSEYVMKEIKYAREFKKLIIPILLGGNIFPELEKIQSENMTTGIRATPKMLGKIKRSLQNTISLEGQIQSLENYALELELALKRLRNREVINEILQYQRQRDLIQRSIEERLTPNYAPFDIKKRKKIKKILTEWESLPVKLHEYANLIEDSINETKEEIEILISEWEGHWAEKPDAVELPPEPPNNYPSRYDGDLFGSG